MCCRSARVCVWVLSVLAAAATASAQTTGSFKPEEGQAGKDVVWVPTPPALVDAMLDLARVGPGDSVIDLGSGDGRNIIAAARRGARALGVEFNGDLVALSRRLAEEAGVSHLATFEQADMFTADISKANVLALFLLPGNLLQLRPKFLALAPGSRIVSNTFRIEGWTPDATATIGKDCETWCEALLWIVPAKVAGRWTTSEGDLTLTQTFQEVSGTLTTPGGTLPITGSLKGADITLQGAGRQWHGQVRDDRMDLTIRTGESQWRATAARVPGP